MFLGHFAVGLAAKKWAPKASLGTLFLASVWLDLLWSLFLLLGWETVVISPGITKVMSIDFTDYSLSHSLVMALAWAILLGFVYFMFSKNEKTSLILMGVVVSHWFLNVIVHRPDMHLLPAGNPMEVRWGLGLWNSVPGTIIVEGLLFAAGLWIYLTSTKPKDLAGQWIFWGLCAAMVVVFADIFFMSAPKSPIWVAVVGQIELLFVAWGYWVDDHRKSI
jgi:hypothetical protein